MARVSVTVDEEHENIIESVRDAENLDSKAAAVRECIERAASGESGGAPGESERIAALQERITELQAEREELIRADVRVEYLESELERVRQERDGYHGRLNELQGQLKVHNSEKPGLLARVRDSLSGE